MVVQTAFRFSTELVERLKHRARRQHKSVNQYVEDVLVKSLESPGSDSLDSIFDDVRLSGSIPQAVLGMSHISLEESLLDDRCRYILEK